MKIKLAILLLALAASPVFAGGVGGDLPNACAITATEAVARLMLSVKWVKMLEINFLYPGEPIPTIEGHCLTCWQPFENGPILIYDHTGTIVLKTHSRELTDIIKELNARYPRTPILAAQFIE